MRTILLCWLLALTPATPVDVCDGAVEGTDIYFECLTGAELDLTPIEDEAETTVSKERNDRP